LLNEIIDIIVNAQKYLYIVTWHFKYLDQLPAIMEALKSAIKRGVKVTAYCNLYGQGSSSFNASRAEVKKLERIGCKVYGDDNNHSKCVLSETRGVVFSANIDGSTGLFTGFEVGCVLTNDQLTAATQHVRTLITN
jgi:phosphatidylserine/phosphatidylglycerophosphate/cardiolipin synthase-like enzyme